eukprot:6139498-Lingulodinium_polyedra.AAC.1
MPRALHVLRFPSVSIIRISKDPGPRRPTRLHCSPRASRPPAAGGRPRHGPAGSCQPSPPPRAQLDR